MLPNLSRTGADAPDQAPLLEVDRSDQRRPPESNDGPGSAALPNNWGHGLLRWLLRGPDQGSSNDLHAALTLRTPSSSSDVQAPLLSPPTRPTHNLSSHSLEALPSSLSSSHSSLLPPPRVPLTLTTTRPLPSQALPSTSPEITATSTHSRSASMHSIDSPREDTPLKLSSHSPHSPSASSHASLPRTNSSSSAPQCMICLEPLTAEDFDEGEAIVLECLCKGDNALRHRSCALKWLQFKGDRTCDVCKTPIGNLPDPPPRPASPPHTIVLQIPDSMDEVTDVLSPPEAAAAADHVFDTIRVTWVAMIFCILFFQLSVGSAFLVGAVVGMLYTTVCMLVQRYCQRQAEAQETNEANTALTAGGTEQAVA